jgi:hypothetical protein
MGAIDGGYLDGVMAKEDAAAMVQHRISTLEERYRSALADATAATDSDQQAYWYGMADAYADSAAIVDPGHVMSADGGM